MGVLSLDNSGIVLLIMFLPVSLAGCAWLLLGSLGNSKHPDDDE